MPANSRPYPIRLSTFRIGLLFLLCFARPAMADPLGEYQGWFWETGVFGGSTQLTEEFCFGNFVVNFAGDLTWSTDNTGTIDVCFGRTTINSGRLTDGIPLTSASVGESQSTRPLVSAGGNLFEIYGEDIGDGEGEARFGTLLSASSDNLQMLGGYESFSDAGSVDEFRLVDLMVKSTSTVRNARTAADLAGTNWRVAFKRHEIDLSNVNTEFATSSIRSFELQAGGVCSSTGSGVFPEYSTNADYFLAAQFDFGDTLDDRYVRGGTRGAFTNDCTYSIDANKYLAISQTITFELDPGNPIVAVARFAVSDDNRYLINAPAPVLDDSPRSLAVGYRAASQMAAGAIDGTYLFYLPITEFGADGAGAAAAGFGDRSWQEFDLLGRGKLEFDSANVGTTPDGETGTWYSCDIEMVINEFEHEWTGTATSGSLALGQDSGPSAADDITFDDCDYKLEADGALSLHLVAIDPDPEGGFEGTLRGYVNDSGEVLALTLNQVSEDPFNPENINEDTASILFVLGMKYTGDPTADADADGLTNLQEFQSPLPPPTPLVDVDAAGDQNSNDAQDLGVLLRGPDTDRNFVYVMDGASDAQLSKIAFGPELALGYTTVADLSGDSIPEHAVLVEGSLFARVKNPVDGTLLGKPTFDPRYEPFAFLSPGDIDGDTVPDLMVVGRDPATGLIQAQSKRISNNTLVSRFNYDKNYIPEDAVVLDNIAGSAAPDIAVLGVDSVGRVRAQIKDSRTGSLVNIVYFDRRYSPLAFSAMPDTNGNLTYLAVLGRDDNGVIRAQIKRAADATLVSLIRFDSAYDPIALLGFVDSNADSSGEIAVIGVDSLGKVRAQAKEIETASFVSIVNFDPAYQPVGASAVNGVAGTGRNEIAVLGESDGQHRLQIKDLLTGAPVNIIGVP